MNFFLYKTLSNIWCEIFVPKGAISVRGRTDISDMAFQQIRLWGQSLIKYKKLRLIFRTESSVLCRVFQKNKAGRRLGFSKDRNNNLRQDDSRNIHSPTRSGDVFLAWRFRFLSAQYYIKGNE